MAFLNITCVSLSHTHSHNLPSGFVNPPNNLNCHVIHEITPKPRVELKWDPPTFTSWSHSQDPLYLVSFMEKNGHEDRYSTLREEAVRPVQESIYIYRFQVKVGNAGTVGAAAHCIVYGEDRGERGYDSALPVTP